MLDDVQKAGWDGSVTRDLESLGEVGQYQAASFTKNCAVYLDILDILHWPTPSFIFAIQALLGPFFASIILASNALKYLRPVIFVMIFQKTEIRALLDRDEDEERAMESKAEVTFFNLNMIIQNKNWFKTMLKRETCTQS